MSKLKIIFYAMLFCLFLFLVGCGGNDGDATADEGVFEVAVIPAQSIGEMQTGLDRLEEELAQALNREVSVEHYPNYNAVVEAINYSHIDLAFLGPLTYLIAHENSGAQAILTQLIDGEPYYYSYMISHVDQPWDTLDEALDNPGPEGINFAFASISSTSGSLIPGTELVNRGVFQDENNHNFASVRYTGSHDITARVVENKDVEIGAIDSAIYGALVAAGAVDDSQIKIVWQSNQLYQYPWVVPHDMDEEMIGKVQEAFLNIDDEEILKIFGGASAFTIIDDSKYADVLEAAREFNMLDPETID
ncbi:phosphate/phosphite/phosphonate ABC transporter substrate-binding protein [Evansella sp. AB-P1]|uniref:phosphate/phosphite/phosphonate ABC transporter substrate-binding protein n=1 Tax=Evansella sp. AB-P1 TaxID=3037653 RepID=UPI00241EF0A5|nr:phosphate/phosphite/phosphonate ABC transporter substrate-binding protein [Evansella sp. AB-P1]MDG5787255.1 phosphate/phosphite/phosphonate ABC transporter substrate-binding protein [Evansella sp. AB-P1]